MPSFPSPKPKVSCFDDLDFFKDFENEFLPIVYNDALTSKSYHLTGPTLKPQHIDEFDLKDETSLSKYDEVEQNMEGYTKEIVHDFEKRLEDLGGARLSMTWRQIILALGLHTADEMAEDIFEAYWLGRSLAITVGLDRDWVALGPERQPVAAAAAPGGAEDAPDINEGAKAVPTPIHAPPQPLAAGRTMPQRLGRLEEEIQGLRQDCQGDNKDL
ncbi:hypothetical protein Tco_0077956 [Tanacetum coccineum]